MTDADAPRGAAPDADASPAALPDAMGTAAAGFALSQLLLAPPERGFLLRMRDSRARKSWPLHDAASERGLAIVAEGFEAQAVREEWDRLSSGFVTAEDPTALYDALGVPAERRAGFPPGHLGLMLTGVAHGVARSAHVCAAGEEAEGARLAEATRALLAPTVAAAAVLQGLDARTAVFRAAPHLVDGFLDAAAALTG